MALAAALLLLPMSLLAGLAIDMGRILLAREQLQQAASAAAQAGAQVLDMRDPQDVATQLFKANIIAVPHLAVEGFACSVAEDGAVVVEAKAAIDTSFLALVGPEWQRLTLHVRETARRPEKG